MSAHLLDGKLNRGDILELPAKKAGQPTRKRVIVDFVESEDGNTPYLIVVARPKLYETPAKEGRILGVVVEAKACYVAEKKAVVEEPAKLEKKPRKPRVKKEKPVGAALIEVVPCVAETPKSAV